MKVAAKLIGKIDKWPKCGELMEFIVGQDHTLDREKTTMETEDLIKVLEAKGGYHHDPVPLPKAIQIEE